jgi:hypothetical protein
MARPYSEEERASRRAAKKRKRGIAEEFAQKRPEKLINKTRVGSKKVELGGRSRKKKKGKYS